MGKRNRSPTTYDLFVIGEQLRCQMAGVGLVKDNRHHLRKHRQCFVAKDAIDWIIKMHHVDTRQEAVDAMLVLQEFNVIHHVTDDQEFKDKNSLFRFSKDDDTYRTDRELKAFYRGLEIYDKIKQKGKDVLRNVYVKGDLHTNVFYGNDLVDFLQEWEETVDREDVVEGLKDLLDRDIIKHMSDDCHFVDDQIVYEFNIDFYKSYLLHQVLEIVGSFNSLAIKKTTQSTEEVEDSMEVSEEDDESDNEDTEASSISSHSTVQSYTKTQDSASPNKNERVIQLRSDNVGFGLVLRGSSPPYVHTISPLGPAAKRGIKVGQSVTNVNGQSVYHMDHRRVGLMIAQSQTGKNPLKMTVSLHPKRHQS